MFKMVPESQGEFAFQISDHGIEERGGQGAQQPLEQHEPEVGHVPADNVLDHLALHGGHENGHERAAHQSQRVYGQQAHLGRPKAGHHEPQQLLQLHEKLAVYARPCGPARLLAGRRLLAIHCRRRTLRVVVVVCLARRTPGTVVRRRRRRYTTYFDIVTAAAHLQHDRVADLATIQEHGGGQHSLADVIPSDDAPVQVFGYHGGHDATDSLTRYLQFL